MANTAMKNQEMKELSIQLNEIRKNNGELREEKSQQRKNYQEEILRMEREHEDKVLLLLRQLSYKDEQASDLTLNKDITQVEARLKFQSEELAKMSDIHDKLLERDAEVENLKAKLSNVGPGAGGIFQKINPSKPSAKKRVTIEHYSEKEYFDEFGSSSDEEEDEEDTEPQNGSKLKKKPSKSSLGLGCTCKKGCKTKACSCKKAGNYCVVLCKCDSHTCANREVPGTDVSSSVETDKENDSTMASDEEVNTTDQLLDSTYNLKPPSMAYGKSPVGSRSPMKSIFGTPTASADNFAVDSDTEATPRAKLFKELKM